MLAVPLPREGGLWRGENFWLRLFFYSQRAVFASLYALFSFCILYYFSYYVCYVFMYLYLGHV